MTVSLWRIATDTPEYSADDTTGKGAEVTGGRWNRIGNPAIYSATNIALATLETLVHFNTADLPLNRILVRLDIPPAVWDAREVYKLEVGWDVYPAGRVSLNAGDAWLKGGTSALLEVPSAIVPEESNILLNPGHVDIHKIAVVRTRLFLYDARLVGSQAPASTKPKK